jgi:hypothetical protein
MDELAARYHRWEEATRRVARAAGELQAARETDAPLAPRLRSELETLADRLRALQMELANETERAWNRAEATARQARRARMMGQVHDATTPEAPLAERPDPEVWRPLGPLDHPGT